jgi:hypothetical protein
MSHRLPEQLRSLLDPAAYGGVVSEVTLVETHISWVLLAGEFAYKIKRAVQWPFVDQRALSQRRRLCEEELRLNRRFASQVYLDVVPITVQGGGVRFGGTGTVIEYAVRMRRFDRSQELDELLRHGSIEPDELAGFGDRLARIHAQLARVTEQDPWGSAAQVHELVLRNFAELRDAAVGIGEDLAAGPLQSDLRHRLQMAEGPMRARREHGYVRECHGDLHARNIVRLQDGLTPFDCVEFEPAFRWIDVADEVALLKVDLEARGCAAHAWAFCNAYLQQSGDYAMLDVLALYEAHRALVRAKVAALSIKGLVEEPADMQALRLEFRQLLACARRALCARRPRLILMSGLSGSGKSWLATRLARAIGIVHVRSDVERRCLAGLAAEVRSGSSPGEGLYTESHTRAVYARLRECARCILAGGYDALVDATFLKQAERAEFAQLAAQRAVPLLMLQCQASMEVLRTRLTARSRAGTDASEADAAVLNWQVQHAQPVCAAEGLRCIEVATDRDDPLALALRAIGLS